MQSMYIPPLSLKKYPCALSLPLLSLILSRFPHSFTGVFKDTLLMTYTKIFGSRLASGRTQPKISPETNASQYDACS